MYNIRSLSSVHRNNCIHINHSWTLLYDACTFFYSKYLPMYFAEISLVIESSGKNRYAFLDEFIFTEKSWDHLETVIMKTVTGNTVEKLPA